MLSSTRNCSKQRPKFAGRRASCNSPNQAKKLSLLEGKTETVDEIITGLRKLLRSYHKYLQDAVTQRYRIFDFTGRMKRSAR